MNSSSKVIVIGAGVSGISTSLLLLEAGYKVQLISKHHPLETANDPTYVSSVPSASVIPHSVYTDNLLSLFRESQQYFSKLYQTGFPGLTMHEHYELYTKEKSPFPYTTLMENFTPWEKISATWHPVHPGFKISSGWKFDCFFADWSLYFPALFRAFLQQGGIYTRQKLSRKDVFELEADILINCSELGAISLFNEQQKLVDLGHLVKVTGAPLLKNRKAKTVSYNFTPPETVYTSPSGVPMDIYCYPREDGWILGGSRLRGSITSEMDFEGEEAPKPLVQLDGKSIPQQILQLNEEIISHSFGINMSSYKERYGITGYRYIRSEKNGLRIEAEEKSDKLIIHNYGHGGAGVTLSWGCALQVLSLLRHKTGK